MLYVYLIEKALYNCHGIVVFVTVLRTVRVFF